MTANLAIRRLDSLPRMRLTPAQFLALPEYSCTVPTFHENWLKPDRFWRRLDGSHDLAWRRAGGKPFWTIGAYRDKGHQGEPPPEGRCFILWFKPVIVIPAVLGWERPGPDISSLEAARLAHA